MSSIFIEQQDPAGHYKKAVKCASGLIDAVAGLNAALKLEKDESIGIAIGLAAGNAVFGKMPFIRGQKYSCIGKAMTEAFNNSVAAGPGQIGTDSQIYTSEPGLNH